VPKLRIAFIVALSAGTLTLIFSVANDVRLFTLLYRVLISMTIFGLSGYIFADNLEKFYKRNHPNGNNKGQNVDLTSEAQNNDTALYSKPHFRSFTPDSFENISQPKH